MSGWSVNTIPVEAESVELATAPRLLIGSPASPCVMTDIGVLSYNVRYANRGDHHDAWHERRDAVARLVRFHRPDVAAFQEPVAKQRRDLRDRLPGYEFVGRGREANGDGEGCPIAVDDDRWELVDDGTFWLSATPAEPSTDWGAAHPRIATWARIAAADGPAELLVVNTHFDHVSARARRESARLLRTRLPTLAREDTESGGERVPVVLVGDLNCTPGSDPHRILLGDDPGTCAGDSAEDTRDRAGGAADSATDDRLTLRDAAAVADLRHGPRTSLTDFARLIDGRRIDHALVSAELAVEAFATLADRDDRGRYPSDHLPILTRASL